MARNNRTVLALAAVPLCLGTIGWAAGCSPQGPEDQEGVKEVRSALLVRTSLDPQVHGFAFDNGFHNFNQLPAGMDFRSGGLCGGMSYAVMDHFNAHLPITKQWYRPAIGTPLQTYLYARQYESIWNNLDKWGELILANPFGWRNSEMFKWGLNSGEGGRLRELRQKINTGEPALLGLKGKDGTGDHQVIAFAYDMGAYAGDLGDHQEELKIHVLDPNYPLETKILVPDTAHEYYTYEDNKGERKYLTYYVDQNYHAKVPPDFSEPTYPADGLVHELVLDVGTGEDDMRGGSDNLNVVIALSDGSEMRFDNVNASQRWISNYHQFVSLVLPRPVDEASLSTITLSDTFGGGWNSDNWDMKYLRVHGVFGSSSGNTHKELLYPPHGFRRFTGNHDPLTLVLGEASTQPRNLLSDLWLTIVTGDDNLGDWGNDLGATIRLKDGTEWWTPDLNQGQHWEEGSTHFVRVALRRPVLPSELESLMLSIRRCEGFFCDNWKMTSVEVDAMGNGIERRVGSHGYNEFRGDNPDLLIPLDGGADVCDPNVVLAEVPPEATIGHCGGPVSLAVPVATDTCAKANVPVAGTITEVNGASASIPVNPDGTVDPGIPSGVFVVTWTSTNTTGPKATQTQEVTLVNPGPTLTPWNMTEIVACAGAPSALPRPSIESSCPGAGVQGAVTVVNGAPLATPIPVGTDGTVADLPSGDITVRWTGTDDSGVSTQVTQEFTVSNAGPCMGGPGGLGGWTASGGTLSVPSAPMPPGGPWTGLRLDTPPAGGASWNAIESPVFSTEGMDIGAYLKIDIYVPANANPYWLGDFQAYLTAPSAGIYNAYLGLVQFMSPKLPVGQWSTVRVPLGPSNVAALSARHDDVRVTLAVNVTAGTGPWYLGNFRFED